MATTNPNTKPDGADKAAKAPATKQYLVVSQLEHNGETYKPRSKVSLTAKEAAPLLGHTVKAAGGEDADEEEQ